MLGLCFVVKKIVCKDDVFLALKATNCKKICTRVYRTATPMGLIVVTIKLLVIVLQQPILFGWD